ncbi:MAG: acetyl-CoA carboxylase carboxyltransferase subunit alpha [Clostridium sp.]|uniref:acetyl-CoA carboxylase carboxyltransferase subunit alpha n=2 Tax=Clostridium TaxID=1485 RepID=UPI0025C488C3|nr:acetyl-CoA carboxylase carboxyltransferase subunit alpha [Clostridium sp.]MDY2632100.1 acetyl-CoA carboxylase carboxyltransferase subunit alpha [Clostridium sp.]MDY4252447.1 acetyl-CoA carboxylase carboxyltransferase subunit alpha [Clostridium sp.]MDY6226908.1 acetyl-CoA carboxylase carboxyltransferase subunit alpha [Clostridium sp.]
MVKDIKAYDRLMIARMIERPTTLDYINKIFTNFFELHGDRIFRDDKSIVGGIGLLNGRPTTIIGIQKGKDLKENMERNFGSPHPEGYRKALRLMKQAEKFNRPIVCFINTSGAYCGIEAEERGQGEAIARNLMEISKITVPIISIIIGEGGSGGAIALACGDRVWMLENSVYSILSPEGFASILLKDPSKSKEVAEIMGITSYELLERGIIEKIIKEPKGGAHRNLDLVASSIKDELLKEFKILLNKPKDILLEERYQRFRKFK